MCGNPWKSQGQKRGPLDYVIFVDHLCKSQTSCNSLQEVPHIITSIRSQSHVFKPIVWGFFTGIVWFRRMLGLWWVVNENCMWPKLFKKFKRLKASFTFLLILEKKAAYYKISRERRIARASVVGLDELSSNLWIIILHLIT